MNTNTLILASILLTASACSSGAGPADTDPERGPIGKTDLIGTCEGSCNGPAALGNCWCDEQCEGVGDCCADKAEMCELTFQEFELFRGGFCAPEADCTSRITLLADGTLLVDKQADPDGGVHTGTVDAADLSDAIAVLTDPALLALLDGGDEACSQPTDIFESMKLVDLSGEHRTAVTFCDAAPIEAARTVLRDLADKYIASTTDFHRFRLSRGGFCPPTADCSSSIELLSDGTLLVDRQGELDGPVHEASVTDADLSEAIEVLTDPGLVALLDGDGPACDQPTDIFEGMLLEDSAGEHRTAITFCDIAEINAARETLNGLSEKYIPAP